MMIITTDALNREHIADRMVVGGIPDTPENLDKAQEFCDWANTFSCSDHGGSFYQIVENGHRLSRGMEDLI
ncbi:hypothetical protein X766_16005 [Mesorhizobium sp. LSJC255A00]|uniref:hypothetical protein n=1 Tax=Mesorhizobium sp. LSJC255A00 TaxID=1287313 RepID=UPI0003CEC52F|nr:hypothetical protein [Mesorhizobium sp. LSJC255A00]ESX17894.1 hypothetical protein X766_16005 [Mesorhizobium sp. LSJC255A00]